MLSFLRCPSKADGVGWVHSVVQCKHLEGQPCIAHLATRPTNYAMNWSAVRSHFTLRLSMSAKYKLSVRRSVLHTTQQLNHAQCLSTTASVAVHQTPSKRQQRSYLLPLFLKCSTTFVLSSTIRS